MIAVVIDVSFWFRGQKTPVIDTLYDNAVTETSYTEANLKVGWI